MLGRDVVATAPEGVEVVALRRAQLDVTDEKAVRAAVHQVRAEAVINCAAYTAVDRAESEPERAEAVNAVAPGILGRAASGVVVHFSTDYVFDGTARQPYRETDAPAPLSVYGRTKLAGEGALAASGADHVILRTSWLYGLHGRSFPRTMWERARAGQTTRVVHDQTGRPTYTRDLAEATWRLVQVRRGILHISNVGEPVTWYGIALRIFQRAGRAELVSPCTTVEYPTPARRPAWSVLDTTRFDEIAGPLPAWGDALDRFLDVLEAA